MNTKTKTQHNWDTPETLLVISLYPKKGETYTEGISGVAAYTKNVVTAMSRPVVVLADYQNAKTEYTEQNTLVKRCFKPNTMGMWQQLYTAIREYKYSKKILIQFDFSMYGSIPVSSLLIPFVALLRVSGYDVSVVSHSVVKNVQKLSGHIGLGEGIFSQAKAMVYNLIFALFYMMLGFVCSGLIILEEKLREALQYSVHPDKIKVIPLAVDADLVKIDKSMARKKLGIKKNEEVVLFFGFVNWFKGADFFAEAFKHVDTLNGKPARFIIAGGESATLKDQKYYRQYYKKMQRSITESHRVEMTGYVPADMIKYYFSAADLVVFPYRYFMSASAVLSMTFSYQVPFIVSEALASMLDGSDFIQAMKETNVSVSDICFPLTRHGVVTKAEKVLRNGIKKKLISMAQRMRQYRSLPENAKVYEHTLFAPQSTEVPVAAKGTYAFEPAR